MCRTGTGQKLGGQYGSLTVHRRISAQSRAAEGRGQSRGMVGRKKSALEVIACESRHFSDIWVKDDPTVLNCKDTLDVNTFCKKVVNAGL